MRVYYFISLIVLVFKISHINYDYKLSNYPFPIMHQNSNGCENCYLI